MQLPDGMELIRRLNICEQLRRIASPTLVCVCAPDPVTPPAAAEEIVAALPEGIDRIEVLDGAGHLTGRAPLEFVREVTDRERAEPAP